ncbi:hypothetical protein CC1G_04154 [Coprinopsis cinerea okayama7|uniref:Uncharacterized protein n=1 Tax=Coprinopsis cinerea (strain Okayama-7 / 130 / ATCC MYA-4618 / FGSC 9003) TaxID=240176 RepID=A8NW66_COPC7|nr:hypothetical protein CC1G_04154 [Coprinopsis cinerea okayama7\|eukprot:XP_001836841.2 hypothetical protein CC1G_04154 [Coprinopsis cinerea okayama7\
MSGSGSLARCEDGVPTSSHLTDSESSMVPAFSVAVDAVDGPTSLVAEAAELRAIIRHLNEELDIVEQDSKVLYDLLAIAVHLFRQVEDAALEERDPDQDEDLSNHWILASVVFSLYKDRFQSAYGGAGTTLQALYSRVLDGMNAGGGVAN